MLVGQADRALSLDDQEQRILHNSLEGLQELGARSAVDDAVIARHRHLHHLPHHNLIITDHRLRRNGTHSQNAPFGW